MEVTNGTSWFTQSGEFAVEKVVGKTGVALEAILFVVFLVLAFTLSKGFLTIFGAVYLFSLGLALGIAIRMRATIESDLKLSTPELGSKILVTHF